MGPGVHAQEVGEAVGVAGLATRGVHAHRHAEALGLFVDRPEERIRDVASGNEGREHEADEAQARDRAVELAGGFGRVEIGRDGHAFQTLRVGLAPVGDEVVVGSAERRLVVNLADLADPERRRGVEKRQIDALLGHVVHHLARCVGVSPHVAVGRLAPVPLGAGKEGAAAAILLREIFLVAPVREVHDMTVAVHDEDAVAHKALPDPRI